MSKLIRLGHRKTSRQGANKRQRLENRRAQRRNMFRVEKMGGRRLAILFVTAALIGIAGYGIRKALQAYHDGRILTVNRIEVTGNRHWESSHLLECAGLEVGSRLPGVSVRSAREALRRLPGIQDVKVRSSLDGELRVEVEEEDVLAMRQSPNSVEGRARSWEGLTPSGAWMPLQAAEPDLPAIDVQTGDSRWDAPALARFLAGARSQYPQIFGGFSQISVRGSDEADVYWRDGRFRMRLDYANKSLNSLEFLNALMVRERDSWAPGSTVDLRVEGYAYVQ